MDKLSDREREVAEALHRGMSRLDICRSLGISANTLANYLRNTYLKLGIQGERKATQLVLMIEREKAVAK